MSNLKPQPTRTLHYTLRDQRDSERDAWTASLSRGFGISASDSVSRGRVAFGRRSLSSTLWQPARRTA